MAGTRTGAADVATTVGVYFRPAATAATYVGEEVILFPCRLTAVKVYASTAGTGGGNTTIDLLKNGTSVWSAAGNRPTLAATSTGEFANTAPNRGTALNPGDVLSFYIDTISTTGHARLACTAALERP